MIFFCIEQKLCLHINLSQAVSQVAEKRKLKGSKQIQNKQTKHSCRDLWGTHKNILAVAIIILEHRGLLHAPDIIQIQCKAQWYCGIQCPPQFVMYLKHT